MEVTEVVERLHAAIDDVTVVDLDALDAPAFAALIEGLQRAHRRLDHERHRLVIVFDGAGHPARLGYRNPCQFLVDRLHLAPNHAGRWCGLARDLHRLPTAAEAWAAGEIDVDHVRQIRALRTDRTAETFDRWEPWLTAQAVAEEYERFRRRCLEWRLAADPDGPDPAIEERSAHVSTTLHGTVVVDALLDAVRGATFTTAFERIVDELLDADRREAAERLGTDPSAQDLARTPAQRRADALVQMAIRADRHGGSSEDAPRALVTVVTGLDALAAGLAELWDGTPLRSADLAALLATDPDVERFAFGGPTEPIRHNPRRRFFTGRLRRAVQVRDRHCTGRGCLAPVTRCDVDHIEPASRGGATTAANGRLACGPCNRARPHRLFRDPPQPGDDDPP